MADGRLTAVAVRALSSKPGFHADGGGTGLYLRVGEGRRGWLFRYKREGRSHWLGLGASPDVSLAQARESARQCREQLRQHIDPLEARRAAERERQEAQGRTFEAVAGAYIEAHRAGWKNEKHGDQWTATLKAYVYPAIGGRAVASIAVSDVLDLLKPIWLAKPETASRVRGRVESVLDYAKARHWRTGENPAAWKGGLDPLLPSRSKVATVEHHAAVPWRDLPLVMARLAEARGVAAQALRFAVLTAARSGEARGADWSEIDLETATWTVPGARMKAKRAHRVPLSPEAAVVLRAALPADAAKPEGGLVFPGGRRDKPLTDVAVSKALAGAGGDRKTVHGMRSSFRDWCAEATNTPREIAEACLAHVNANRVEAAYLRGDALAKRRELMERWGRFVCGGGAEVVQFAARMA